MTCTWREDEDGVWEASCGTGSRLTFQFNAGGPADNGALYCMYCGKPLVEESLQDEEEE